MAAAKTTSQKKTSSASKSAGKTKKADTNAKYVVYAAGYTRDHRHGIWIYDYDHDKGRISYKSQVEISNT